MSKSVFRFLYLTSFFCLSEYLSTELHISKSYFIFPFIFLTFHLSIFLSVYLSIFLCVYLSIFLSVYLSILSICLHVCIAVWDKCLFSIYPFINQSSLSIFMLENVHQFKKNYFKLNMSRSLYWKNKA